MSDSPLRVMVLAGGPDRERPISLLSGRQVAPALQQAGHEVRLRDIGPADLACLDEYRAWPGDVLWPVLHGAWGEGGPLQRILQQRGLPFVGSAADAADCCMDKHRAKVVLAAEGLPTPPFELLHAGQRLRLRLPVVLKALREGSSIDLAICRDRAGLEAARADLHRRHPTLLAERFVRGRELTVGIIAGPSGERALPPIQIVPAAEFYDYQAKYERADTRYLFDINLPAAVLADVQVLALAAHRRLGCRHLSRVDFIVDRQRRPWILELNTMPGFTVHSLVPMAAARTGLGLSRLVDRLVRLPLADAPPATADARRLTGT